MRLRRLINAPVKRRHHAPADQEGTIHHRLWITRSADANVVGQLYEVSIEPVCVVRPSRLEQLRDPRTKPDAVVVRRRRIDTGDPPTQRLNNAIIRGDLADD